MSLAVDQLSLGQIGTNCYLVRADPDATEAVVIDPGAEAAEIRLALAAPARPAPGSCSRTATTTTSARSPTSPRARARPSGCRRASSTSSGDRTTSSPASTMRALHRRGDAPRRRRDRRRRRHLVPGDATCPATRPGHVSYYADGALFSGDVLFAGSVGRTDLPFGDWETLLDVDPLARRRVSARDDRLSGHGPATTLGDELARNPFLAELRA